MLLSAQLQGEERQGDLRPGGQGLGEEVPAELPSQLLLHPQLAWLWEPRGALQGDPVAEVAMGTRGATCPSHRGPMPSSRLTSTHLFVFFFPSPDPASHWDAQTLERCTQAAPYLLYLSLSPTLGPRQDGVSGRGQLLCRWQHRRVGGTALTGLPAA